MDEKSHVPVPATPEPSSPAPQPASSQQPDYDISALVDQVLAEGAQDAPVPILAAEQRGRYDIILKREDPKKLFAAEPCDLPHEFLLMNRPPQGSHHPLFPTPESLHKHVLHYFLDPLDPDKPNGKKKNEPFTISSFAVYLGMTRLTLLKYQSKTAYGAIVDWGKAQVEAYCEGKMYTPGCNPAGAIFSLCNNFGPNNDGKWRQRADMAGGSGDSPGTINVQINFTKQQQLPGPDDLDPDMEVK